MRDNLYSPELWDAMLRGKLNAGVPQTLTGAGAISVATLWTELVTTGANALTLANGEDGQLKLITMNTAGGVGTITPTSFHQGTTMAFDAVGDAVLLMFHKSKWGIVANTGVVVV
jgi:hypothetical protein